MPKTMGIRLLDTDVSIGKNSAYSYLHSGEPVYILIGGFLRRVSAMSKFANWCFYGDDDGDTLEPGKIDFDSDRLFYIRL